MNLSLFYTEHLRSIKAKFGLIWDRGYRGKYLNMISNLSQIWQEWSIDGHLAKLCPTADLLYQSLLKIENSLIVYCCFIISQNGMNFLNADAYDSCQVMAKAHMVFGNLKIYLE
jgi:hypothetical protein